MELTKLKIEGAFLLRDKPFGDERGVFTETWEHNQFKQQGIYFKPSNSCFSYNKSKRTLRGMHYQDKPHAQSKLVTCTSGSFYDVILDLRENSTTYLQWQSVELVAFSGLSIYIPAGCAHGFLTLENQTVVSYLIEGDYFSGAAKVARYNDPAFNIKWPELIDLTISPKDMNAPDFII